MDLISEPSVVVLMSPIQSCDDMVDRRRQQRMSSWGYMKGKGLEAGVVQAHHHMVRWTLPAVANRISSWRYIIYSKQN